MQSNRVEEFEKIVKELNEIIDYFYKNNDSKQNENDQSNKNKNKRIIQKSKENINENRFKLRQDYPKGYVQMAEVYKMFYLECIRKLKKGKDVDIECEPSYRKFYKLYLDPKEVDISSISDKGLDDNIKNLKKALKTKILEYYAHIREDGRSYSHTLYFCKCKSDNNKELCLCVKENPETTSKEKNNDEMVVDYGKSEKVLANIKRKGLALYAHFLGVVFPLEFAAIVSVYYIIGFFVALFTHKIFVTNMNDIFEILLFTAIMIIISFIEIYKDYAKLLDSSGKRALSNITKLSLIPFFSIKEKSL